MAAQFLALVEETTRGTDPGSGYIYLPIMGSLQPKFDATDESRKEFRGVDTALGDASVVRRSSQWTYSLECAWYPGAETGLLFKHLMGFAGTRATIDTSGKKGILYPVAMPYGVGLSLVNKAIGFFCCYDKDGVAKKRYYGGGRVKSCTIKIEGTDDVKLTFEIVGPGEYIGAEAANDLTATFPTVEPFVAADALVYVGAGATRTGTAPNYTELGPNTMTPFYPDSLSLTITGGLDDKIIINGVQGPSKTHRASQFLAEISAPIDLADPASGFSSADEYDAIFTGPTTQSLMIVLTSPTLVGAVLEPYSATIDLPYMLRKHSTPDRKSDGSQPTVELSYQSLVDPTIGKPLFIETVDAAAAY